MIAIAISMITVLAATQVYVVWEEYKRTTVTGSEAQQNGILALQVIQHDLHNAGYGVVGSGVMGCRINATNDGGATSYVLKLVPALLSRNTPTAGSDSIDVLYSTANGVSGPPAVVRVNHPSTAANFFLDNTIGFAQGDFIVAFQPGKDCTLMQTTNNPTLPSSNTLVHNSGLSNYNVPGNSNFPQSPPHATSGYDAGSLIFNLGQLYNVRYQIENNRLLRVNLANGNHNDKTEIAEGIVALRAQYGIDAATPHPAVPPTPSVANGDSLVDAYVDPRTDSTPNHAAFGNANQAQMGAGWARVYSIRVAVVARSSLREKTEVSPATLAFWPGGPSYTVPDRNYRYKVYHTIAPLRNLVWRKSGI